jgi:aminopeptidase N
MKLFLTSLLALASVISWGQANKPLSNFDILQYDFGILVTDENDSIKGVASLKIQPIGTVSQITLNLQNINEDGKGMLVENISAATAEQLEFKHANNILTITTNNYIEKPFTITISYKGIPENGLIIGKNKFGNRTWFGDNWPTRGQYWLPCIDHPADKAMVNWTVIAPQQYMVTANGVNTGEIAIDHSMKKWTWEEKNPIPIKVAVIGVAHLQKTCTLSGCIPVCNYFYPETFKTQPTKMAATNEIIKLFEETIGDYPYAKLNNVQSTTMFGGMENASTIFYDENAVDANSNMDALLAHEIAHQWFGNTVTEKDFSHIWLSEGFATFLTHYYLEKKYGVDSLNKRLAIDKAKVKGFLKSNKLPVVNTTTNYMSLLNANSYERGGLFLQALRKQIGEVSFLTIIKNYYSTYKYKNANTDDFRAIVEKVTKKDFKLFFKKWLYEVNLPD